MSNIYAYFTNDSKALGKKVVVEILELCNGKRKILRWDGMFWACFKAAKDRSVPKLTDWDFGIPLVIFPKALRTHFEMKIGWQHTQQNKSLPVPTSKSLLWLRTLTVECWHNKINDIQIAYKLLCKGNFQKHEYLCTIFGAKKFAVFFLSIFGRSEQPTEAEASQR